MTVLNPISILVAAAVGFVVIAYGLAYAVASRGASADVAIESTQVRVDVPDAASQIAFWSKRVAEHPDGYLELTLLGQALARSARETSDVGEYARAEAALRRALRVNPRHVPAAASLSGVLFALHDFEGALATARPLVDRPDGVQALATLGDAHFALGRYRRAQSAYARLLAFAPSAAAYARLAFLAELRGRIEQATRLLERAVALAEESGDYGESLAWYRWQLGELAFRAGRVDAATSHHRAALRRFPGYPPALAGLAKANAARGEYGLAIRQYRRATEAVPQPEFLAALGDLYLVTKQRRKAREQFATVEVIAKLAKVNRQVYNRQLANFYADHGLRPAVAQRLAVAELAVRKDVYGYDTAAWASYRNGDLGSAQRFMKRALALGTHDARLYYHAGMIARGRGRLEDARRFLSGALLLNERFDPVQAPVARRALESLAREGVAT